MSMPIAPCTHPHVVLRTREITRKRRSKFGVMWLLATVVTGGFALILYIIWPRHNEVIGVDRWNECTVCHKVSA